jgi:predicted Zn-dependent peptidase
VWIDTGSRNERADENGYSHLIEHLVFKGTKRRSARQIAESLESLGGGLNGFTSREQTCYHARVLDEFLDEAVDVLADISCNPTITPGNVAKERTVVCEEIKESLDTPSDRIHDLFSEAYWGKHPLGQPIMGSQKNILGADRKRLRQFMDRRYRAESIVIAASGSVSHTRLVRLVKEKFRFLPGASEPPVRAERTRPKHVAVETDKNNQTHLCVGFPGIPYSSRHRYSILGLSTHLGGGMSSVLFQRIREQQGMAYSVYTFHDFYRDAGVFGAYAGTDAAHVQAAFDVIMKECQKLRRRRLSGVALDHIKAQLKGTLTLAYESTNNRMNRLGRQELMQGEYQNLRATLRRIEAITADDVLEVANLVFDESRIAIAVLGPVSKRLFRDVAAAA